MNANVDHKRAFDEFIETIRLDIFGMYEQLRAAQRGDGRPMSQRLSDLNRVAETAGRVYESVGALNTAVWFGMTPDVQRAPDLTAPRRVLAGVR